MLCITFVTVHAEILFNQSTTGQTFSQSHNNIAALISLLFQRSQQVLRATGLDYR